MKTDTTPKPEIESLAETFALIHGKCLQPFYQWDGKVYESDGNTECPELSFDWDRLPEKSDSEGKVDKDFFRRISKFALEELSSDLTEMDKLEQLADIVSRVHGYCLAPFYSHASDLEYTASYEFKNLPDKTQDRERLDKGFVLRIARHIISKHPVCRQKV